MPKILEARCILTILSREVPLSFFEIIFIEIVDALPDRRVTPVFRDPYQFTCHNGFLHLSLSSPFSFFHKLLLSQPTIVERPLGSSKVHT
jgi:hypothetical protein